MVTGRRSARRRRANRNRGARIAAILAIPVALGLLIGIVIVVFGGHSDQRHQSDGAGRLGESVGLGQHDAGDDHGGERQL